MTTITVTAADTAQAMDKIVERLGEDALLLEPVKRAVPSLSYADVWQLAALVSVRALGGALVAWRAGREAASGPAAPATRRGVA